jgi:hypothetical protein
MLILIQDRMRVHTRRHFSLHKISLADHTEILHHVLRRHLVPSLRHRHQPQRDKEIVLGEVRTVLRGNLPDLMGGR